MDPRDVDLSVTRRRRPRQTSAAPPEPSGYATDGSAALAVAPAALESRRAAPVRTGPRLAVAPPPPVPVPRTPFVMLILLVVVGGVVGILLLNTKVNENAFILHDLRQEQELLDQRQQRLEEQIARAHSPAQLVPAAHRLGLVRADELAYLRLPSGEVVFEPVAAAGEPSRTSQREAADAGGEGD